ncbi:MAG: hypothetical protein ACI3ZR_07935 [bacterium]
MILADKKDYQCGYRKHYHTYKLLSGIKAPVKSRLLLLTYCVECGLKGLLLDQWNEPNPKKIIYNNDDRRSNIIKSHNLDKLLKELRQTGTFKFPRLQTRHHDMVTIEEFHQLCRYGIGINKGEDTKENEFEKELLKIAKWIGERI